MQVFKLYWKLLRANLRSFFIYGSIFTGLLFGVIIPNQTKTGTTGYVGTRCDFAVCDEDNTGSSGAVIEYLGSIHNRREIKDFGKDTIQDELFYRNVDAVLILHEGFEEAFEKGDPKEYADIYVVSGTMNGSLFEQAFTGFISKASAYMAGGFSVDEALEKTKEACAIEMPVQFLAGEDTAGHAPEYYFFIYLAWIFVAMCIQSVAPVLCIMDRKEVKNRVFFSAYKFSAFNLEVLMASMMTGLMICIFFFALAAAVLGINPFSLQGVLWFLNMICMMLVAMSLTLFASRITSKDQVLAALSNVISLGMAFLCGVFVPAEYLGAGVLKAAHFMPVYWYVQAIDMIGTDASGQIKMIFSYMGIELLFAGAITAVAFMVAKRRAS